MRIGLLLVVLLVPGLVHANQLRVTSYDMDEAGGTVHLLSDAPIGETWLRVDAGQVRIWFPHIIDIARFDHERGPGEAIRTLLLRPGASDTAVLKVQLGVVHQLAPGDVEITRNGAEVSVHIRVPGLTRAAQPVAKQLPTTTPAVSTTTPAVSNKPVASAVTSPPATPAPAQAISDKNVLGTAADVTTSKSKESPLATGPNFLRESKPTLMYLLISCVVLGLILAGLQLVNRKKPRQRPEIEVLGARRLGHRQELVIVRALGSDHLLLCTGGRAERVASTPSPVEPAPVAKEAEASQAGGIGLIARLSSHHRLRKLLDNVSREPEPVPEPEESEPEIRPSSHPFGAELFSAARKQQRARQGLPPLARSRQSESVAGINRLRKRAAT
jgi:hypothetical protein